MSSPIRVTVWNEGVHEKTHEEVRKVYPNGMHAVIAEALQGAGFTTRTATLDEPEHGLTQEVLAQTDVLTWWGHMAHNRVEDAIADRVAKRVLEGMGLIVLHSGHMSKPFLRLMGTTGALKWREIGERERLWVVDPTHPIVQGLEEQIVIEHEEMYGEHFDVPAPDQLVYVSWFQGGEVFRSGCCWNRGMGKIFYFRPGHETYPTYYQKEVQQVIINAVKWAAPVQLPSVTYWHKPEPLEKF
ncbi:MAG: ThuA domain-containing protein [Anaerolineae bacterium]|nr:ThuA domain-containing protein [Anaerolineae bacterium]